MARGIYLCYRNTFYRSSREIKNITIADILDLFLLLTLKGMKDLSREREGARESDVPRVHQHSNASSPQYDHLQ